MTIPFSSITFGERARSTYSGIETLADSIFDHGLIQPVVLVPLTYEMADIQTPDSPQFGIDAGGRRCHALQLLLTQGRWDGILHHAVTSEPGRPGYVLKGEAFSTPLQRLMTELAENLDREDMDWRDEIKLLVRAYKLTKTEAHIRGEDILMRDFGAMVGVDYNEIQAAVAVHDDFIANPDRYKDCTSVRQAKAKLLARNALEVEKVLAARSIIATPLRTPSSVSVQSSPEPLAESSPIIIPLTSAFINCDSLAYMESLNGPTFDHIVTDPDYAVSVDRLRASVSGADSGVNQETVEGSLSDLYKFIELAYTILKDQGFLVFWFDLDHWENLRDCATHRGFAVQRWPLIWLKSDYRSNSAPAYNFCKNYEVAMVCRKANAVLSRPQMSSVFTCASGTTTRDFNHPFAKPLDVSKWIYSAIAIKGQTTYDPFLGSGAISVAAVEWGLKPVGSEINSDHYTTALMNLQRSYKKMLGNVTFS